MSASATGEQRRSSQNNRVKFPVHGAGLSLAPAGVRQAVANIESVSLAHFTEVLFVGFFMAAGLYGGLLFLMTRDRVFLAYAALMDALAAAQLVFAPELVHQIFPAFPPQAYRMAALALLFAAEAGFAWAFLHMRVRLRAYATLLGTALLLNIVALFFEYADPGNTLYAGAGHLLFLGLLAIAAAASWESLSNGARDARFYFAGFAGAFAGAAASAIVQQVQLGPMPEYLFQFGVAWQGALVAVALASRYTQIDPLTGAKSRDAFEQRLRAAWEMAEKRRTGLAVVTIAVDGLRDYDARYGRIAGDAALRDIANACVAACGDRLDLFARYGDEALAAIVTRVSRAQADEIGRRLERALAGETPLAVGIGVASKENAISAEALSQQAARRSARDAIRRITATV
jgi:diguanylate cyclase (GGDEF)-like protein